MFTSSRFVVLDDNENHLTAIVKIFQLIGSPCMGIRYDAAVPLESKHFRGVRVLFIDLHLLEGLPGTDENRHFAQITSILEENISATGGPYVLVVWTRYPGLCDQLRAYLNERLDPQRPHARPISVTCLDKEQFINVNTGDILQSEQLRAAVQDAVLQNPQLAAMLTWETDVLSAAGETLTALLDLVPYLSRRTNTYPSELDKQLSRLAVASVGKSRVPNDRRAAVNAALAPILSDRIQNQTVTTEVRAVWDRAVTRDQDPQLDNGVTQSDIGIVNKMLHVATPDGEAIGPTDWGAVTDFPEAWNVDEAMRERYGHTVTEVLGDDFKIRALDQPRCRLRLVRVGAVCDHAQGRSGPIPYLLGLEIPVAVTRDKVSDAEWQSPVIALKTSNDPFRLHVNSRYLITQTEPQVGAWPVVYRLREQLLMDLVNYAGVYVSRPGIIFTGKRKR